MFDLKEVLQPIADWVNGFGTPDIVNHWGHPFFMSIVIFAMGTFVGISGWRIRKLATTDAEVVTQSKAKHRQVAPLMYVFLASGYIGGLLSLVIQDQPLLESPHFWTGSVVIILLTINALISGTGFIGNKATLRTVHAYLGSLALAVMVFHAFLGLKLGLSI